MNKAVLLLYALNFAAIGALPTLFFKKDGRFNARWWLTAAPFFLCPPVLAVSFLGYLSPLADGGGRAKDLRELASVCFSAASLALLCFTLGTHRIPIALWHQDNDAPRLIVTYGAYRRVRHPMYASFLLAFFGAFLAAPHWTTLSLLLYAFLILTLAAAGEEARLRRSEFGAEYASYMRVAGRFWPKRASPCP